MIPPYYGGKNDGTWSAAYDSWLSEVDYAYLNSARSVYPTGEPAVTSCSTKAVVITSSPADVGAVLSAKGVTHMSSGGHG